MSQYLSTLGYAEPQIWWAASNHHCPISTRQQDTFTMYGTPSCFFITSTKKNNFCKFLFTSPYKQNGQLLREGYWRKYVHEVLVNRLGLSLPRKSVVRLTDRPDTTLDVYHGRKTTMQQQQQLQGRYKYSQRICSFVEKSNKNKIMFPFTQTVFNYFLNPTMCQKCR